MPNPHLRCPRLLTGTLLAFLVSGATTAFAADALEASIQEQSAIDRAAQSSQDRVDQLADETRELLQDYLLTSQQIDRLRVYNTQLEKLVDSQEERKQTIEQDMQEIEVVEQEITPLMLRMIDSLDRFIELDLPFQTEERKSRVANLREIMDSADFTVAEKYRQVMDAYQQETEYGRTIYAYRGALNLDGQERNVDFLQVGRVLLAFQTLDRSESGFYDRKGDAWSIDNSASFRDFVDQGLRIARKQSAPNLLMLPVPAPETAAAN